MNRQDRSFLLRPAEEEDQQVIRSMVLGAGLNPLQLHWKNFLLAEDQAGAVIGCGQIKQHRDGSKELASIYVVPQARGSGIAREIIAKLLAEQVPPVWLTCRRSLTGLYTRFGFQEVNDLEAMPSYFRRVSWLMGMLSLWKEENPLAVMRWRGKHVAWLEA